MSSHQPQLDTPLFTALLNAYANLITISKLGQKVPETDAAALPGKLENLKHRMSTVAPIADSLHGHMRMSTSAHFWELQDEVSESREQLQVETAESRERLKDIRVQYIADHFARC